MSYAEQTPEFNKLYNKLLPTIERMYNSYSFLGLSQEKYTKLIRSFLFEIYQKNSKEKIDNETYLKKLKAYIDVYVKISIKDWDNFNRIIDNFINQKLSISSNDKDNISQIKKLSSFLEKYEYIPTPDTCGEIIKSNEILSSILKKIVHKNLELIKSKGIESLDSDIIFITLVDVYCMLNDISYQKEEDKEELNLEYDASALDQLGLYLLEIRKPLLTAEEERELAIKASQGSTYAREKLIERNLRWVVRIARGYQNRGLDFAELIQEGNIGLITAVDKFDYTKGYRLTTYSSHWIRQAIGRAICDKAKAVRLPVHVEEKINKYKKARADLEKKLNREPTLEEIAKVLKMSVSSIEELLCYQQDTISLNSLIGDEEDTEFGNFIPAPDDSPEEKYTQTALPEQIKEIIVRCNLTEREMEILMYRHGFVTGAPKTLEEVGQIYGVTRERIRQIENKALRKIRQSRYSRDLAQLTSNPDESLRNIGAFRGYYNTFGNSARSLQKKGGMDELRERLDIAQQEPTSLPKQPVTTIDPMPSQPMIESAKLNTQRKTSRAVFTIFDTFAQLGYTREEVLSVIPKLPNLDRKRVNLRNGQDLDNPIISPFITERDRNLYITKTLPAIEGLLVANYGKRTPPKDAAPTRSIYDEFINSPYLKGKPKEFTFPKDTKELLVKCNLSEREIEILMHRYGFLTGETKTLEEIGQIFDVTKGRVRQIELTALRKIRNANYYRFFIHQIASDKSLQQAETIEEFRSIIGLIQYNNEENINQADIEIISSLLAPATQSPNKTQLTIFEFFDIYGYTKEEVLSVLSELPRKDRQRIKLMNGQDLENPTTSLYATLEEKERYETITLRKIRLLLKSKYGPRKKSKKRLNEEKKQIVKEENAMKKYTIYEYFELFGYTKEEIKEILLELTEKEKEFVQARNGDGYLNNPVYNKTITPAQRTGYARVLNKMMKKLTERYGTRHEGVTINEPITEKKLSTQVDDCKVITDEATETRLEQHTRTTCRKNKKTIFQRFITLGYTREEIEFAISKLSEENKGIISLIDGDDLDHPSRSKSATRQDDTKYYTCVIPKIKSSLKKAYGVRNVSENIQPTESPQAASSESTDVNNQQKNMQSQTTSATPLTGWIESPEKQSGDQISSVIIDSTQNSSTEKLNKEDYIKILELFKTVEFEELMRSLGPEKATIIALRLGYVKGKYYSVEAIANFLDIEQKEVMEITGEILNIYKSRVSSIIDTAITHLDTAGPTRKLIP